jgi:hypothetical protein
MSLYIITMLSLKVVVLYTSQSCICPRYCDKDGTNQWACEVWREESSQCYIEGEDRFDTVGHVEG